MKSNTEATSQQGADDMDYHKYMDYSKYTQGGHSEQSQQVGQSGPGDYQKFMDYSKYMPGGEDKGSQGDYAKYMDWQRYTESDYEHYYQEYMQDGRKTCASAAGCNSTEGLKEWR